MENLTFVEYICLAAAWGLTWAMNRPSADSVATKEPTAMQHLTPTRGREAHPQTAAKPALSATLRRICVANRYKDIEDFIAGAERTHEAVVTGFARGDLKDLGYLMSAEVRESFEIAMAERETRGEVTDLVFVGFQSSSIVDAAMEAGAAWIEISFVVDLVSVTRDLHGGVVAGSPGRVVTSSEVWRFEKELRSSGPVWLLAGTGEALEIN